MSEVVNDELLHNYNFYLSMGDIVKLDICKGSNCSDLSQESLLKVLWDNGLNTKRPYQVVFDQHRCLSGEVHKTNRFVGFMRDDEEWKEKFGAHIDVVLQALKTEIKYRGCEDML